MKQQCHLLLIKNLLEIYLVIKQIGKVQIIQVEQTQI